MNDPRDDCATFYAKMEEYFLDRRYADVRIVGRDLAPFYCHRVVLAAASEYFKKIFDQHLGRIVFCPDVELHPNISSDTFKLILRYMYSGKVNFLEDINVYHVLLASDILKLPTVRRVCLHYLSQSGIPKEWAVHIFLYACEMGDKRLQTTASRYLLQNKDTISLTNIRLPEFKILLSNFRATSRIDEELMMEKILEWTVPWNKTTMSREEAKSHFVNTVKLCPFEFWSPLYAAQYFDRMIADTHALALRKGVPWGVFHNSDFHRHFALHMFTRTGSSPLKLTTLAVRGGEWDSRHLTPPAGMAVVQKLRSAVAGNKLYWMRSRGIPRVGNEDWSLKLQVSSSVDLSVSEDLRIDPTMNVRLIDAWHMCSDGRSTIFACTSHAHRLYVLNCEKREWSQVGLGSTFSPRGMTWYDRQLYVLGGESPMSSKNVLGIFDPRVGAFIRVLEFPTPHRITNFEACSHRELIYFATASTMPSKIVVMDPVAGRMGHWLVSDHSIGDKECRLASFQDTLWTFFCDNNSTIRMGNVDPYAITWKDLHNGTYGGEDLLDVVAYHKLM